MNKLGRRVARPLATLADDGKIPREDVGAEYAGEWLADQDGQPTVRCGAGRLERVDGTRYVGGFEADRFHGKGELAYPGDDAQGRQAYVGLFANGQPHGQGALLMLDGGRFDGTWEKGAPSG